MKVFFSLSQCCLCRHTQKSDIMRHKRVKKIADQPIDSYIFLTFCQKNEVSQLSDVPVATFLCVSFVINGYFAFGFSFPC